MADENPAISSDEYTVSPDEGWNTYASSFTLLS